MNTWILTGLSLTALCLVAMAGPPINKAVGHRVVFEFVSEEPSQQDALLNNVENLLNAFGAGTQIMVVAHGSGLNLLYQPAKAIADRIAQFAERRVTFAACQNTMRKRNLRKEDLMPVATTVDSGVAEVVRRQEDGWSYIKSGH